MIVNKIRGTVAAAPDAADEDQRDRRDVDRPAEPEPLPANHVRNPDAAKLQDINKNQQQEASNHQVKTRCAEPELIKRAVKQLPRREPAHIADYFGRHAERICAEEDPGKTHQTEGDQNAKKTMRKSTCFDVKNADQGGADGLQHVADDLVEAVQRTPHNEGDAGAVPDAAHDENNHDVQIFARLPPAVAAERDVDVIAEPVGERLMPAAPEIGDARGKIRAVKILAHLVAQHLRGADRYFGVAREVAVNLESVQDSRQNNHSPGVISGRGIDRVYDNCHPVSEHELQEEAPDHAQETVTHVFIVKTFRRRELWQHVSRTLNRAGHYFGEERHEQRVPREIPLGRDSAAVNVDHVAERLQHIERNPDRDDEPAECRVYKCLRIRENRNHRYGILAHREKCEIDDKTENENQAAGRERG